MRRNELALAATFFSFAMVATTCPALAQGPADDAASGRGILVHVDARRGVVLLYQSDGEWKTACTAPCDQLLPVALRYRAGGGGLAWSPDFTLDATPGARETVVVRRAGKAGLVLGIVGLSVGPVVNLVGLGLALAAANGDQPDPAMLDAGLITAGVGSLMFIGGLILTIANARLEAAVSQEVSVGPAGADPASVLGVRLPIPTWAAATTETPVLGVPILVGRF